MLDAGAVLGEARAQAGTVSYSLEPGLEHQTKALEHLENAIRILEPPQEQQDQDQDQQEQQQDQVSQQQAQRRLQAIRDREAQRERERKNQQRSQPDPVEKDW